VKTDKSRKVGSSRRSKGPAANPGSVAKTPRGRPVLAMGGRKARTNDGKPAGSK